MCVPLTYHCPAPIRCPHCEYLLLGLSTHCTRACIHTCTYGGSPFDPPIGFHWLLTFAHLVVFRAPNGGFQWYADAIIALQLSSSWELYIWPNWFCCLNFQYLAISSSCECLTNFYLNIAWKWHVKVATFQPQQSQIPWVGHLPHLISIEHPGPFKLNGSYVSAFLAAIWPYLLHYVLASTELCCKIVATSIIPLGSHLAVAKTNTGGKGQKQPTHTQGMPINCGGK